MRTSKSPSTARAFTAPPRLDGPVRRFAAREVNPVTGGGVRSGLPYPSTGVRRSV